MRCRHHQPQHPADALGELWPRVFAYALSFSVIGIYWLAHWRRYLLILTTYEGLARLNLLLLGLVAFIPFPTMTELLWLLVFPA